jgi:hypothetical protein
LRVLSDWGSVRIWETQLERELHRRYSLRMHGLLIGGITLSLMWLASTLQMHAGVDSLALRYLLSLGVGYGAYLLTLRWWAQRLVAPIDEDDAKSPDAPADWIPGELPRGGSAAQADAGSAMPSGGGGDFGGGGATGDFGAGELAGEALGAAASADEGAIVVVPVLAVFLAGLAVLLGAGALVLLYFGIEALLAVAIELAFGYAAARPAVRVTREGWLLAAVRLSWKPLLGALLCAVLLGAAIDRFVPQANSLPQAMRIIVQR